MRELSPNLRNEVQIIVDDLLKQTKQTVKPKLRQDWAGMLKANSYTSVELQHLASEWRNVQCFSQIRIFGQNAYQGKAEIVAELLDTLSPSDMCMTDFTLHSIGVICNRLKQRDVFVKFVDDVLIDSNVLLVNSPANKMKRLVVIMDRFGLGLVMHTNMLLLSLIKLLL